jgi:hypothetical protein
VPYWKKGSITMIVVVFVFIGFSFVVRWVSIVNLEMWLVLTVRVA